MQKRILICVDNIGMGGLERQLIEQLKLLSERGYYVDLVSFSRNRGRDDEAKRLVNNLYYIDRKSKLSLAPFFKFYQILKKNEIDIVHSFSTLAVLYALLSVKLLKRKLINGTIRHAGVSKGFFYLLNYLLLRVSDHVVSNSYAGIKYFKIKNKYTVIYNFIDPVRFNFSSERRNILIMVAKFSKYKDHQTFLLAARKLLIEQKIERVILIGGGPYFDKFKSMVQYWNESPLIEFLGRFPDGIEKILSYCRIGVLCSTKKYAEGLSNSLLEYMGSGLLAIGSDVGGTSEIIEHGTNGLLFEAENPEDLYEKISWVLSNPDREKIIVENAKLTISRKFDANKNIESLITVYQHVSA
jgi:glycosyltransferase involved in cell wall biosynthesis